MRSEKEKMLAGELYRPGDPQIQSELEATKAWLARYSAALDCSADEQRALLRERLAAVGAGCVVRPAFYCDYGFNIRLGADVFLNFNCVILDVVAVEIGDGAQRPGGADLRRRPCARSGLAPRRARARPDRFASAAMSGSAAAPSFFPASPSATKR